MTSSLISSESQRAQILTSAVERRLRLVVTHRRPDGWRAHKAQFLACMPGESFSTALGSGEPAEGPWPEPGTNVGISFRIGHKKCMFSTTLRSLKRRSTGEQELTFGWPAQLQQLQRRVYERVAPPPGEVVAVRFWRTGTGSPVSPGGPVGERDVKRGQLEDISAGGMRIKVPANIDIETDATYECIFAPRTGAPPVIVEATLRHRESAEQGRSALGFQFIGLETSAEGQKLLDRLARIVGQFQRAQPREGAE